MRNPDAYGHGAALELAIERFGGPIVEGESVVSVGTSAGAVVPTDPERVFLLLVNLSLNTVYIGFTPTVSSARGILLGASGGSVAIDVQEDGTLPTRAVYALATAAASELYVLTLRRDTVAG